MKITQNQLTFLTFISSKQMCHNYHKSLKKYIDCGLLQVFGKTVKMVKITKVGRKVVKAAQTAALKAANDEFSCYLRYFS